MDGGSGYRAEAERWLMISEKLLTARDVQGAKSFAIRARESDPRLMEFADQIIAVADTLLAGDLRVNVGGGESFDYYAILQIPSLTQSMDVIASQYRRLALLLNPNRNRLVYCDQAFNLVNEAWLVFSDPNKKAMYDHALQLSQLTAFGQTIQLGQYQEMPPQEPPVKKRVREEDGRNVSQPLVPEPTRVTRQPTQSMFPEQTGLTREPIQPLVPEVTRVSQQPIQPLFTEPPRVAPQQVTQPMVQPAPAPPPRPSPNPVQSTIPEINRPMQGASTQSKTPQVQQQTSSGTEPHRGGVQGNVAPSGVETWAGTQPSPVETEVPSFWTTCPYCFILYEYPKIYEDCALKCQKCRRAFQAVAIPTPPVTAGKEASFCCWGFFPLGGYGRANRGYKVIYEDEDYINLSDSTESDSSDDDWRNTKKTKTSKRKATFHKSMGKSQNERTKKVTGTNVGSVGKENMVALGEGNTVKRKGAGKLDLNVMFSNEADEAATGAAGKKKAANKVVHEDNMEGIGFFEGLDEFLSTLPILSVVGDDKVKAA